MFEACFNFKVHFISRRCCMGFQAASEELRGIFIDEFQCVSKRFMNLKVSSRISRRFREKREEERFKGVKHSFSEFQKLSKALQGNLHEV